MRRGGTMLAVLDLAHLVIHPFVQSRQNTRRQPGSVFITQQNRLGDVSNLTIYRPSLLHSLDIEF